MIYKKEKMKNLKNMFKKLNTKKWINFRVINNE